MIWERKGVGSVVVARVRILLYILLGDFCIYRFRPHNRLLHKLRRCFSLLTVSFPFASHYLNFLFSGSGIVSEIRPD